MRIRTLTVGPLSANCYLVSEETADGSPQAFLVDPGMEAMDAVVAAVEQDQVEVEAVVLTHGHIDHVCDAALVAEKYSAPVYIHPADAFMLEPGNECPQQAARMFGADIAKLPAEVRELSDGQTVELAGHAFTVHHAPGHSPGCVLLEGDEFVLTGDVLFRGAIGRVDVPYSDPQAMQDSLRTKVKVLDDDLEVYPGHGPRSQMGEEKLTNPFLVGAKPVR